ncbi:MAG: autotransporter outer membrane beta-barrel domain-containing protein [Verrucomicrobiales bacterium]|nr:autotransporter outer membrane beta-barrel domain-containing protein [Verrucomicrobiales bacterium]
MATALHAQTVVYQDVFDNDTLAINTGIGGGLANRSFGGHFWEDNGNLNFNRSGGNNFVVSATTYSMNTFQSDKGFELSVNYSDGSFGAGARRLSFGLISDTTDLATYTPSNPNNRNPFGGDPNLYSIGLTVREGLTFSDGTSVTTLDAANVQTGSAAVIKVLDDGMGGADWSYLIDGVIQGSGNIATFDFASSYRFAAYGQDNEGARSLQAVSLAVIDPDPIITVTDNAAILQLISSAIPSNIAIGQVASQVHGTGLRDLNKRIFRLRSRIGSGGGFARAPDQNRGREVSVSRLYRMERDLKVQSTINLNGPARASNPQSADYENARFDDHYPLTPRVTVQAGEVFPHSNGLEAYASYDYGQFDLNPLGQNAGVESRTHAGTVGVEYVVTPSLAVGLGFTHVENDNELSNGLGAVDLEGNAISGYASYFRNNLWGDLLYSQGDYEAQISRNTLLGTTVSARPNVEAHQTTLNLGYNIPMEDRFTHGPTFRADYSWGKLEGYTERGDARANTIFEQQNYESLITTLGWQLNWRHETHWGAMLPQFRLGYGRENTDRETNVSGTLQNSPITFVQGGNIIGNGGSVTNTISREDPGEGWMEFGAGMGFDFHNNFSLTFDYNGRFFQQDVQLHQGTVKATWRF